MKTNELRIGNCILIDCIMYKEERKVTEICLLADDANITVNLIENSVDISYFGNLLGRCCLRVYNAHHHRGLDILGYDLGMASYGVVFTAYVEDAYQR